MGVADKKPVQVYLRAEQLDALRALSKERGVSVAELIRQGIDQVLAETPLGDDPLWGLVGLGDSGLGDLSVEHDRYLAEIEEADNSQHGG